MISAHDSPVAALTFNASGTKLASASEKVCVLLSFVNEYVLFVCSNERP